MQSELLKIKKALLKWYQKHHRDLPWRQSNHPYKVWISEIMLQQTRVEAVKGYYARFLGEIPDVNALANVSDEKLLKLWEGLGYYNRAKNLKRAAQIIIEDFHGVFPNNYEDVISLPGIGSYTAGAICSICFDLPTPAVDGNVLRVVTRILECFDNIDELKTKRKITELLVELYQDGNCCDLTQALMELGAVVCIPNGSPKCMECPIKDECKAYKNHSFDQLPVRTPKKKRKIVEMTVFILHDEFEYAIRKRDNKGLLANMWEFYHVDRNMDKQEALDYISKEGYGPICIEKEIPYTHIFSHIEWHMKAFFIRCQNKADNLIWVSKSNLEREYALPSAFRFFIEKEDEE